MCLIFHSGHWAAFTRGVLHRDLSEGNVLITGSTEVGKRAVIIDFDYAKMLEDPTLADDPISVCQRSSLSDLDLCSKLHRARVRSFLVKF